MSEHAVACPTQMLAFHRIELPRTDGAAAAGVQALIETRLARLGVQVELDPNPKLEGWTLYFRAPGDVDLDFLRPHVLPPKPAPPTVVGPPQP